MENTTSSNVRVCATCVKWNGDRIPMLGGFVKIKDVNGKCYLFNPQGVPRHAMQSCDGWEKWPILK
jgi:hypothetical protein